MAQEVSVVGGGLSLSAASGGTTDFTEASFGTLLAALGIACAGNGTNNPSARGELIAGVYDGTDQRTVSIFCTDGVTTSSTIRTSDDSYFLNAAGAAASTFYTASTITDGLRATNSVDNTALARFASVLMLKGVSAKVVTFTPNATQNATANTPSIGFAPKLAICISISAAGADTNGAATAIYSIGVVDFNGTHRSVSFGSVNSAADEIANILYSETRCMTRTVNNATVWGLEATAWNADDITFTTRDGGSSSQLVMMLVLGGADLSYQILTLTTPTSTGVVSIPTTVTPEAVFGVLTTATGTTREDGSGANGVSQFLLSPLVVSSHGMAVEDGAATMNCNSDYVDGAVKLYTSVSGTFTTLVHLFVNAITSAAIDLNYTTVDATPRKGFMLVFGPTATGQSITPANGAIILTGQAPTAVTTERQTITPSAGAVLLTGQAPTATIAGGQTITADTGAILLLGQAPTVVLTAHQSLTPDAGSILLSGQSPSVVEQGSATATPDPGALYLTGQPPEALTSGQTVFGRSGLGGDDIPYRRNPNRGWDKKEYFKRKKQLDELQDTIKETYQKLMGTAPEPVVAQAQKIVRPTEVKTPSGPELRIDWEAIARSYERTNALIKLAQEEADLARAQDEEEIIMLAVNELTYWRRRNADV